MRTGRLVIGGLLLLTVPGTACRAPGSAVQGTASVVARVTGGVAGPVEGQLAAYNAHDLDRFLSYYTPDVQLHSVRGDSTFVTRGEEATRRNYTWLTTAPAGFRAEIVSRMVAGRYVIDHERLESPGAPARAALATYEVRDGLIPRVWFLPKP